jgi:hypothetical protein
VLLVDLVRKVCLNVELEPMPERPYADAAAAQVEHYAGRPNLDGRALQLF